MFSATPQSIMRNVLGFGKLLGPLALRPEGFLRAFVHYPAGTFPGQTAELKDNTHFTNYGACELARCVVEGIGRINLPLAIFLTDHSAFDPAHPDSAIHFTLPLSPFPQPESTTEKTQ
jgi:hypothetical protein